MLYAYSENELLVQDQNGDLLNVSIETSIHSETNEFTYYLYDNNRRYLTLDDMMQEREWKLISSKELWEEA